MAARFAPRPLYVIGIYFFCDYRCWRCPLSHRCRVPAWLAERPDRAARPGASPSERVAAAVLAAMHVTVEEVLQVVNGGAALRSPDRSARSTSSMPNFPSPLIGESRARHDAERDASVRQSREYARLALAVFGALRRVVALADPEAVDALDRLEETALTIATKTHRAVASALTDPDDVSARDDANGSAKVALLLIEESRRAWHLLAAPGRGLANGTPARFALILDGIETGLLERFPHAFDFVRPGFDTPDAGDALPFPSALLAPGRGLPRA